MGFKIAQSENERSMDHKNLNQDSAKDIAADSTINEQDNVMITAVEGAEESY